MLRILRVVYGLALVAILLFPFGVYHSRSEPYIIGYLWGYYLPIGYLGLVSGLFVFSYHKISFTKKIGFGSLMILIGILLIVSFLLSPKDFFVNLIHGTSFSSGQIDIDYPMGNSLVWVLSLFSIGAGLFLRIKPAQTKPL
jgi:branched-subunit amino acid transport protein AzlD